MGNHKSKKKNIYKNWKKIKNFGDIEIQKQKFHQHKGSVSIKNINNDKIVAATKVFFW